MTARIVNLRTARKQRNRADSKARGDANAAKFGRTKAQRTMEQTEADKARRHLDGHHRDEDGPHE